MLPPKQVIPVLKPIPHFLKRKATWFIASVLLLAMAPGQSSANVTITVPTLTVYACGGTFPTSSYTLGNIVITDQCLADNRLYRLRTAAC